MLPRRRLLYGKAPIALVCVALFWGVTVVADSRSSPPA
jgi:hypothetical protein